MEKTVMLFIQSGVAILFVGSFVSCGLITNRPRREAVERGIVINAILLLKLSIIKRSVIFVATGMVVGEIVLSAKYIVQNVVARLVYDEGLRMNKNDLIEIFKDVSKRLSQEPNKCGNLIYTQEKNKRKIIREPEMRCVFSTVLSEKNVNFGVEVPTKKKYNISSKKADVANTDLVINPNDEPINIEFKRDIPKVDNIKKDFEKLSRENAVGCAFYNVLKNTNRETLPTLLKNYKDAYERIKSVDDKKPKWFVFFIFIKEKQECRWKVFDDLTEISEREFEHSKFQNCTCA